MKPASCPLASLTDGSLGPAATSPALECFQPTQPCPAPLPQAPGAGMLWTIAAEWSLCCRGSWLGPGELGLSRFCTSLPAITNGKGSVSPRPQIRAIQPDAGEAGPLCKTTLLA